MSDDLLVSGGGSTAVATEELLEHAQDLERVKDGLEACRADLTSWPLTEEVDARVTNHLVWARGAAEEAFLESGSLARALRRSAERYGALERYLTLVQRTAGETAAYWAGMLLPGLVLSHGPAVALTIAVGASAAATPQGRATLDGIGAWLRANPQVVNNALVASLTRTAVTSVDDFGMGAVLAPPSVRRLLGEDGLNIGLPLVGAVVTGVAGGAGLLRESRVTVRRVPVPAGDPVGVPGAASGVAASGAVSAAIAPPGGFADLAARVPRAAPNSPQIRVEQYGEGTTDRRFLVYVGGTADASPRSSSDPWDVTSDVAVVTGADSGAVRATEQAMRDAGVGPDDRVVLAGYSLGGIVAREVAHRGTFPVEGVLTLGSPVGRIPVPEGVAAVSVEHTEDVLAALGGHGLDAEDGGNAVVVRRSVAAELADGGTTLFAAHGLDRYAETAALLDATEEERIRDFGTTLSGFLGDREQGSVSLWRAERIPDAAPPDAPVPDAAVPEGARPGGVPPEGVPPGSGAPEGAVRRGTVPEVSPGPGGRTGAGPGR